MKKLSLFLTAAFVLCAVCGCGGGNGDEDAQLKDALGEDSVLKILTIGNSFSDDAMEYVYQFAQASGAGVVKLGNLYIGGCTLNTHWNNADSDLPRYDYRTNDSGKWVTRNGYRMSDAIASENWDFISLQQASGSSGISSTYGKLPDLVAYVKELAPGARLVWHMTWAYQQNASHPEFYKYESDQTVMYQSIVDTVKQVVVPMKDFYCIIPAGTAIQNARTSSIGDTFTRDGYHLSGAGRYIAAMTFVQQLCGRLNKEAIDQALGGVREEYLDVAVESAQNAVKTPFEVTLSKF